MANASISVLIGGIEIPITGEQGIPGVSISSAALSGTFLVFTLSNSNTLSVDISSLIGSNVTYGGNVYHVKGATAARANPITGEPLPIGSIVYWLADSHPINMAADDVWINDPSI